MLDTRIRLRHLHCFLETARLGSLSAAAQALSVSQPAASKTIKELEQILGRDLFDRSARRLSLTPAGQVFQQHVGAGLIELARAQDLVRDVPKEVTRVTVGVLPTAATELLPKAALRFRASFPDCMLRVSTGPNWLLMSQLREGSLDLVVGRMASAKIMEGLSFQPLYAEQIVAVTRPGHRLVAAKDPEQGLIGYDLILPPPGAVISPVVRTYLSRNGVGTHAAFETVSLAFGRKLVQASDAIWFISQGVVSTELAAGSLVALALEAPPKGAPVGISMRQDGATRPELTGIVAAITQTAAG